MLEKSMADVEVKPDPWRKLHYIKNWQKKNAKYPWMMMGIGDAFRFGLIEETAARTAASRAGKKYGKRFIVVKIEWKLYCFRVEASSDPGWEWHDKVKALRAAKYPWRTMAVDDVFTFGDEIDLKSQRSMVSAASKRYDKEFVVWRRGKCRRVK